MKKIIKGIFKYKGKYFSERLVKEYNGEEVDEIKNWEEKLSEFLIVKDKRSKLLFDDSLKISCSNIGYASFFVQDLPVYKLDSFGKITSNYNSNEACLLLGEYEKNGVHYETIVKNNDLCFKKNFGLLEEKILRLKKILDLGSNRSKENEISCFTIFYSDLNILEKEYAELIILKNEHDRIIQENIYYGVTKETFKESFKGELNL